ncbi:ABC transporter ATP-binding protein [Paenibacillus lycopersici]|nr:ABC transporter ATP-binding protein [Paenibacillus lycopersici]
MRSWIADIAYIGKGLIEVRRLRPWLLTLIVCRAICEAFAPFIAIYMSALIIDGIAEGETFRQLITLLVITVLSQAGSSLVIRYMTSRYNTMRLELNYHYEMALSLKIIEMDYASIEDPETHRLRQKMDEVRNLNDGGIWRLIHSFQDMTKYLFGIVFSVSLTLSLFATHGHSDMTGIYRWVGSPYFAILLGLGILANVMLGMYANATTSQKFLRILSETIQINRLFGYYMTNYLNAYHAGKDIRIYNQQKLIASEARTMFDNAGVTLNKMARNEVKYATMTTISTVLISTLIYLFVGLKALAGMISVGAIVRYVGSINEFTGAFTNFMSQLALLRENNANLKVYFDYLALPSQMYQGTLPVEKRAMCLDGDNEYEIEFRNVSFKYPGSEEYSLRNLSLKFRVGERLAVVGMNGSGKTTFIKLLCRLYDPTEGDILLNGINITKYQYAEYMSIFSVVFQDFKLFSFGLGQNVAATVDYDKASVEAAVTEAGFGERYGQLPDGTETYLYKDFEERGIELSGGEEQKLALARALYKDAPFIILDEPTAALDPVAEFEIYSKFNEIVGGKTAIYISHRLSSCRFCDNIAVFHEGALVQRGSHEALVADADGKYHELWNAQAQYYVD